MLPQIHRLPIVDEIAALWCEIAADNPAIDVDAALAETHATIADRLAEAAEWDAAAAAQHT